jgi:hypothetical protein
MILARLLTAGRSFVGAKESNNRYQVTNEKLLPKFNSRRNPFRAKGAVGESGVSEPAGMVERPEGTTDLRKSAQAGKAARADLEAGVVRRGWRSRVAQGAVWCSDRLKHLLPWRKRSDGPPAIPRFGRALVQPELSLETVKVVRNDLSDSDLEVVAAKLATRDSTGPDTEVPAARSQLGPGWNRVRGRLFRTVKS